MPRQVQERHWRCSTPWSFDGDRIKPADSEYAKSVLDELGKKPHNQGSIDLSLVRGEGTTDYWQRFRLEPEFPSSSSPRWSTAETSS